MDKFQSEINKNKNLYCPVDEVGTSNVFAMYDDETNSEYFRLKVKESNLYPCKSLLLDSIRTFVKHQVEGHTSTPFQKYRLVDHNGIEITTEDLIDLYLSNPGKCFKKDYPLEEEASQDQQRLVQPILNNVWMYGSLWCFTKVLQ